MALDWKLPKSAPFFVCPKCLAQKRYYLKVFPFLLEEHINQQQKWNLPELTGDLFQQNKRQKFYSNIVFEY